MGGEGLSGDDEALNQAETDVSSLNLASAISQDWDSNKVELVLLRQYEGDDHDKTEEG